MLIKNVLIINDGFIPAFTGLLNLKMPAKQCLEVSSCIEDLVAQHQVIARARKAIVEKYCSKDAEGNIVHKGEKILFDTPELQKQCYEEVHEILEEEIDLALSGKIKISAQEMMTPLQIKLLQDIVEIDETM